MPPEAGVPKAAPKGTKHPAQLKPAAACRPARTLRGPSTRAAPPQRHGRRRMAAARPAATARERRRAPDDTLRRQLPREPYPSTLPPCARVPSDRHAQPSAKPADGSQLAPPPQPARGAAAPSSLPSPIRCGPDQKHYSGIAPSSERIASGCTKQAQSHLQLYGILTEITHCSRRILQTTQIGHCRRATSRSTRVGMCIEPVVSVHCTQYRVLVLQVLYPDRNTVGDCSASCLLR